MLVITAPATRRPEREYILSVVLGDFLGIAYRVRYEDRSTVRITNEDSEAHPRLTLPDTFFSSADDSWLEAVSVPSLPLDEWATADGLPEAAVLDRRLPILFGAPLPESGRWFQHSDEGISLGLDVFGSAFFMLTRYEEAARPVLDDRGRFPATASLAYREGFLDRPIVNEYVEVLWACLKRLWPSLQRRKRNARILVSHDVDWPLTPSSSVATLLKNSIGDIVRRRSPRTAVRRLQGHIGRRRGDFTADPYNTFDELMALSESHGLRSAFYFITDRTAGPIDGDYELHDPFVAGLMQEIHARGHEIGLHPSYDSSKLPGQISREFERLRTATEGLGISQDAWGGRQHFLRWEAPNTWQAWHDAGLDYDSTVGYADHSGFRAGTCYEYRVFNVRTRQALDLRERPLIAMEGSLVGERYMNLSYPAALDYALELRARCMHFDGDFTLLWHNSHLLTPHDWHTYGQLIHAPRR